MTTQQQLRRKAEKRQKPVADNGCVCDRGPVLVATFRNEDVTKVAMEHWDYCPVDDVCLNIDTYLNTGKKVPL